MTTTFPKTSALHRCGTGLSFLPTDPPGELEVVHGIPGGSKIAELTGISQAFTPDDAPEEIYEIAKKLHMKM
jgi:hypothetical protein